MWSWSFLHLIWAVAYHKPNIYDNDTSMLFISQKHFSRKHTHIHSPGFEFSGGPLAPTFTVGPPDVELWGPDWPPGQRTVKLINNGLTISYPRGQGKENVIIHFTSKWSWLLPGVGGGGRRLLPLVRVKIDWQITRGCQGGQTCRLGQGKRINNLGLCY